MLTIGEFSSICRVSTKTLRYYAEIGLILPEEINPENGYRYYSIKQLETMQFINRLKAYHFSLEEIKAVLESEEVMDDKLYAALNKKKKEISMQVMMYRNTLEQIDADMSALRKGKSIMSYMENIGIELVELPSHKGKTLNLVIVYGLSEEKPMMLLTNREIRNKRDVHKIVRAYMSRWRIEEGFRFKKNQYGFEKMRVRTIKSINVLNTILMMHIGHITLLAEKVNRKLLVIKMIERSKSLKGKRYYWCYQISKGIEEILKYAHKGIKEFQDIREKQGYRQLQLKL
ncbi:MAG: MerR family transcriptional regulator [Thomasclavelia sp.]